MLRMVHFVMLISRIPKISRVQAQDTAFISTLKRCVTTAVFRASKDNYEFNDEIKKPSDSRGLHKRYRSRLAELYDEMFEGGSTSNQSSTISPPSIQFPIYHNENTDSNPNSIDKDSESSVASYSTKNDALDPIVENLAPHVSKLASPTFVKQERQVMKAENVTRNYKQFEYDDKDIGNYMSYIQDENQDFKLIPEDSDFMTSSDDYPSLESFTSTSSVKARIATEFPKVVQIPIQAAAIAALPKDVVETHKEETLKAVSSNIEEFKSQVDLSSNSIRPIVSILKAASTGEAEPYSSLTLQSQLIHIESEIASMNNGVHINLNSRKQVSMLLYGAPNESISMDALDAVAGGISNTEGKSKLASMILQHKKISKEIKRLEKKKETFISRTQNQGNSRGNTVQENIIVASNGDSREPLVLIDASAYIFRSYYAMPPMHRYDGEPVGATLGVCNLLNKLILSPLLKGEQPRVVMVFDSKDGTNFRKLLYPEYKANRQECPDDLKPQFDFVRDAALAYGILTLEAPGFEADDVIATIATKAMKEGTHVNILSGDKDLMQLVTTDDGGACIELIDPMKMIRFSHDKVVEKWGVEPNQLGDVLALAGDASDNIPGVPNIGPKIASSLILQYGNLENLLKNIDSIKQKARRESIQKNIDKAILSRKLVQLEQNIPLNSIIFSSHYETVSDFRTELLQIERLLKFYDRMGFKDLKARVKSRLPKVPSIISNNDGRYNAIFDEHQSVSRKKKFNQNSTYRRPPSENDISDVPF